MTLDCSSFYFEILKLVVVCSTKPLCNNQKQQQQEPVRRYECGAWIKEKYQNTKQNIGQGIICQYFVLH